MTDKIVFLTFHNWKTKRQGGFHKFAEVFAEKGWEVFFLSLPRPYYIFLKSESADERMNRKVLKTLSKGQKYTIGKGTLINLTLPTLALPGALRKYVSASVDFWFQKKSLKNTQLFFLRKFKGARYFVFESNSCILYYPLVKKIFPEAKIIYRPSDPLLVNAKMNAKILALELELIKEADLVLPVNQENYNTFKTEVAGFDALKTIKILFNGVDLAKFKESYPVPAVLKKTNTALYVGARDIDWDLIVAAAQLNQNINYVIVCPETPNENFRQAVAEVGSNIYYLKGIFPEEVPSYLTNANVVIVPNPKDRYKFKNWGITAKYLQAMVAKKPIIAYHDGDYLKEYGINPVFTTTDFVAKIEQSLEEKQVTYDFDFNARDWNVLKEKFYSLLTELK